jgi:hypothetical protein
MKKTLSFPEQCSSIREISVLTEVAKKITSELLEYFSSRVQTSGSDEESISLTSRLYGAVSEILLNIIFHDHLNVHGEDRIELMSHQDIDSIPQKFASNVQNALGCQSEVKLNIFKNSAGFEVTFVVELCREFPNFEEKWSKAGSDYEPTMEEILSPCGRGMMYIRNFFYQAEYNDQTKTMVFRRTI